MKYWVINLCVILPTVLGRPAVVRTPEEISAYKDFLDHINEGNTLFQETDDPRDAWVRSGKFEGDIILGEEEKERLLGQFSGNRNAVVDANRLWPNKTIYYEFHPGGHNATAREEIIKAMEDIAAHSCVTFKKRNNEQAYIYITADSGTCASEVGYTGRSQMVNLAPLGCIYHGTIVHELLHSVGFYHMQNTWNRDDYVKVLWENIMEGYEFNFEKFKTSVVTNLGVPYDYGSIMHYYGNAFSKNGKDTMVPIKPTNETMGRKQEMSPSDIKKLNILYDC